MAVAVHVRVDWNVVTHEDHFRGIERIFGAKFELKESWNFFRAPLTFRATLGALGRTEAGASEMLIGKTLWTEK